jgi:hypothetical protein
MRTFDDVADRSSKVVQSRCSSSGRWLLVVALSLIFATKYESIGSPRPLVEFVKRSLEVVRH